MGGDIQMSNLKAATGISDDRLSAHHPSGTGNETGFSHFLISAIGRDDTGGFQTNLKSRGINDTYPGTVQLCDEFYIVIECLCETETFWLRQIGFNSSSLSIVSTSEISVIGREVYSRGTSKYLLALRCEVTGTGTGYLECVMQDGMNNTCQNYNTSLTWDETDDSNCTIRSGGTEIDTVAFTDNGDGTFQMEARWWDPDSYVDKVEFRIDQDLKGCGRSYDESIGSSNSCGIGSANTNFDKQSSTCDQDYRVNLKDSSGNVLDSRTGTYSL